MIRNLLRNKQGRWILGCSLFAFTLAVVMLVSAGSPTGVSAGKAANARQASAAKKSSALPSTVLVASGNSRAIAQSVSKPVAAGARKLWPAPTDVLGNKLEPLSAAYKQSLGQGIHVKGRSGSLDSAALGNLATLRAGDVVAVPLFENEVAMGRVNLVQAEGEIVRVGGELTGKMVGSFSLSKVKGEVRGRILLTEERVAYVISAKEDGQTSMIEQPLSDVLCIPYFKAEAEAEPVSAASVVVPVLSSRPTALAVLYLDFDGATVTDPDWNEGRTIVAPPFALTPEQIIEIWNRVKEDFLPFNVDITTNAGRYDTAPVGRRMRCIITPNDIAAPGSGGVAYVYSFSEAGSFFTSTIPSFVFNSTPIGIAEAVSHEFGHTLGLFHDGRIFGDEYYEGHGSGATSWAPIMGSSYTAALSQWSKGEYLRADNQEDDLAIIAGPENGFGYISDDTGDTYLTPGLLRRSDVNFTQEGSVSFTGDSDFYAFNTGDCTINVTALPAPTWANLDIALRLVNSSGVTLAVSNPIDDIKASLNVKVPSGLYFLQVTGVGKSDPLIDGYSNYGSLGAYTLTGTIPGELLAPAFVGLDDISGVVGEPFTYRVAAAGATSYDVNGTLPAGLRYNPRTGLISGTPTVAGFTALGLQATNQIGTSYRRLVLRIASIPIPVVTSPASATGIVATPFQYQITGSNNPTSYSATGLPAGLVVDPLTGIISGNPLVSGDFSITVIATNAGGSGSQTVNLKILASATNLSVAVEANSGVWTTGGAKPWKLTPKARAFDRVDAARSGAIGNNQQSWMQAQISGPAIVSFRWGVDSEFEYDRLTFKIDNVEYASISGSTPGRVPKWRFRSYSIPEGVHVVRWTYEKDFILASKTDAGYVDNVTIQPILTR